MCDGINIIKTYCESEEDLLSKTPPQESQINRKQHFNAREQSEKDFFELSVCVSVDTSETEIINRGDINNEEYCKQIILMQPDLIIVYGSSIIKKNLLSAFPKKILNVHLGLSPYYRGAATNFWPLVDMLPECVGATYMFIDEGIDTGEIIHQIRPTINYYDTPSTIGNRLIKEMTEIFCKLIIEFDKLQKPQPVKFSAFRKFCKKKDYSEEAVFKLYDNFNKGMIQDYLAQKKEKDQAFPIVNNPMFSN